MNLTPKQKETCRMVDMDELHDKLKLTDEQKKALSDALELLMQKSGAHQAKLERMGRSNDWFHGYSSGEEGGLNAAYKLINGIDDDYNAIPFE